MLAIAGGKGGCGKTTTALGIATALARRGHAPTVVDADHEMPALHLAAGINEFPCLTDFIEGNSPDHISQPMPDEPDVSVVPAPLSAPVSSPQLATALTRLDQHCEQLLVDCPTGAGSDAVAPLRLATSVLLVTTLSPSSLRGAVTTRTMTKQLDTPVAGVLLARVPAWAMKTKGGATQTEANRCDGGANAAMETLRPNIRAHVEWMLDADVLGCVPEVPGTSVTVLSHPNLRGAYEQITDELLEGEHLSRSMQITG